MPIYLPPGLPSADRKLAGKLATDLDPLSAVALADFLEERAHLFEPGRSPEIEARRHRLYHDWQVIFEDTFRQGYTRWPCGGKPHVARGIPSSLRRLRAKVPTAVDVVNLTPLFCFSASKPEVYFPLTPYALGTQIFSFRCLSQPGYIRRRTRDLVDCLLARQIGVFSDGSADPGWIPATWQTPPSAESLLLPNRIRDNVVCYGWVLQDHRWRYVGAENTPDCVQPPVPKRPRAEPHASVIPPGSIGIA